MRFPAGQRFRALATTTALLVAVITGGGLTAAQDSTPATGPQSEFFVQEDFEEQLRLRDVEPEGPADQPWVQALEPENVDTSEYAKEAPYKVCFSNAGVNNPWRVVGWTTMQAEVEQHPEITEFVHVDAEGSDEKQITDIQDLLGQNCSILIVSPNTTAALTPAVEQACEQLPVVVFDRGVNTDCPVTFIHPIGGYAFGADAAEFLVDNVEPGGNILALRILPGVDVLETRWSAAKAIFDQADLNVVGVEFTQGDVANTKSIVTDYIDRFGTIDGVWMDAGATSVGAIEAFEDLGLDVPPITGEDQQDFLRKWKDDGLTAVAPTYPTYQWRTPIIASVMILQGQEVPKEWILPEPVITNENLDQYLQPNMPPLHYALCGCENMPGFPERWGGEAS
ncbi:MAG TPA: ABC transporter substrate-binding protein [Thermomicrobiales bacterium]|jgi:ribose transport system substrate-binding protein|nr:ABC transporter substrate-binding protein [Thermomicrobiales bacterium]